VETEISREPLPRYIVNEPTTRTAAYQQQSQEEITVSFGITRDFDLSDLRL